jgi:hypothetical protein
MFRNYGRLPNQSMPFTTNDTDDDVSHFKRVSWPECIARERRFRTIVYSNTGADPTIPEKDGYTPPHGAAFQGRTEVMKVLLEFGVVVVDSSSTTDRDNDKDNDDDFLEKQYHRDGFLPFHRACWGRTERHAELVEYMLESGIVGDADVRSKDGLTCRDMTRNPATIAILDRYTSKPNTEQEL